MAIRYDRERMHKLFLEEKGDIRAVLSHPDTPKSPWTIAKYAQEGGWYKELSEVHPSAKDDLDSGWDKKPVVESKGSQVVDEAEDDIKRLERVRSVIYQFLVPGLSGEPDMGELKPKTYTEAVKCYLEVDSRIDEKKGKPSNSPFRSWEEILRRCISPSETDGDND